MPTMTMTVFFSSLCLLPLRLLRWRKKHPALGWRLFEVLGERENMTVEQVSIESPKDGDAWVDVPASTSPSSCSTDDTTSSTPRRMFFSSDKAIPFDPAVLERMWLLTSLVAWYIIGVGAIVTTKILLTGWSVPPLLCTFQQLLAGSTILRLVLSFRPEGVQKLPWEGDQEEETPTKKVRSIWEHHSDFLLAGLFNALDFLASNSAFRSSNASFVEAVKSSDPITTTAVALAWNVDHLTGAESVGLSLLIVGVLLTTFGNSEPGTSASEAPSLGKSITGMTTVLIANMCFAFRAMFQKRYRTLASSEKQMDDINLLCRMQQTGAAALLLPVILAHSGVVIRATFNVPRDVQLQYIGLSFVNAFCYAVYNLASTSVLSKLTVLQHSSLNCLRRMFAVVATCIFFGVPITVSGALGLLTSFVGFFAFTYFRNQRHWQQKELEDKDAIV